MPDCRTTTVIGCIMTQIWSKGGVGGNHRQCLVMACLWTRQLEHSRFRTELFFYKITHHQSSIYVLFQPHGIYITSETKIKAGETEKYTDWDKRKKAARRNRLLRVCTGWAHTSAEVNPVRVRSPDLNFGSGWLPKFSGDFIDRKQICGKIAIKIRSVFPEI